MHVSVLTLFPRLYDEFLETSLVGRARKSDILSVDTVDLFSFVSPGERIDAPTCGHGAGMLMRPDVMDTAIASQEDKAGSAYKIFFSPQGKRLTQSALARVAQRAQKKGHLMLLPARYEGMDARVEQYHADEVFSIGDFVLMGGDLPAMMLLEGVFRFIPGVVGKPESVEQDSFTGPFFDYPAYTKPISWRGMDVPEVLRSGDHGAVNTWRTEKAARNTVRTNFDWFRSQSSTSDQRASAYKHVPSHYVALMHGDVLVGPERTKGVTSVTSVDIHDIARSARTYGVKGFSLVTPLEDQKKIVNKLLGFWQEGGGKLYNQSRYEAMRTVSVVSSLDEVVTSITHTHGEKPLIVVTSARRSESDKAITFADQHKVWESGRPVLILFGTGQGLTPEIMDRADFVLVPVEGLTGFNHLSVRSAAAIILDRWLGLNQRSLES